MATAEWLVSALASDRPVELRPLALELATGSPDVAISVNLPSYRARIRPDLLARAPASTGDERAARLTAHRPSNEHPATRRGDPLVIGIRSPGVVVHQAGDSSPGGREAVRLSLGDREAPPASARLTPLTEAERAGASLYPEWD
jgi:hypothetical protein